MLYRILIKTGLLPMDPPRPKERLQKGTQDEALVSEQVYVLLA